MYRIRKQLIKSLSQTLTEGVNELGEKNQIKTSCHLSRN
jgi:hypothetical protein